MKPRGVLEKTDTDGSCCGGSQVFLFSKTLPPSGKDAAVILVPDGDAPVSDGEISDGFSNAFPGVRTGQDFVDAALSQMAAHGFSVLMIRPDTWPSSPDPDGGIDPFLLNTGYILDQMVRPPHSVWGRISSNTLGCFLAETDQSACRNLAAAIRSRLTEFQKQPVSIGIAVYPLADFSPRDSVLNAWKAMRHAAVLGSGNTVVLDAVSLNLSGDGYYQSGNLRAAVEEYRKALQLDASNVNVHNSLGVCYGQMGLYDAAESEFTAATQLNPSEVMALYNRGVVCLLTGRKDGALEFFLKASAVDGDIFELALLTGKMYLEAGNPEKARSFLEKAVQRRPKSGTALRTLGACLSALNHLREAAAMYSRAVKSNPNDAESLSRLGMLYDAIGENPAIARLFCEQSVAIAPENPLYRERLEKLGKKRMKIAQSYDPVRMEERRIRS